MLSSELLPRPEERRLFWVAFAFLFLFVLSHSVLESAREALFLSQIPATKLPWVYLAIAVLSLQITRIDLASRMPKRTLVVASSCVASVGTFALGRYLPVLGDAGLYALYVWSGVVATFVLVQFYGLLGDLVTVAQAKRLYPGIGLGPILGAIAGNALVGLFGKDVGTTFLPTVTTVGFGLAAFVPYAFPQGAPTSARTLTPVEAKASLGAVFRTPHAMNIIALTLLTQVALTMGDFVFKSLVVESVPAGDLARTFGLFYGAASTAGLVVQLFVAGPLLRRVPVPVVVALLPGLMFGGALTLLILPIFPIAMAVRGLDGMLRYSVHRTAIELLLIPLGDRMRGFAKSLNDVIGVRFGQVFASVLILVATALGMQVRQQALGLALFSAAAALTSVVLRGTYVRIFRDHVRQGGGRIANDKTPALDVASLETLIATLDSENDEEVLAALSILERDKKANIVPTLILYHPSEQVVVSALRIFARLEKKSALGIISRLDGHPSPRVRAEATAARAVIDPDVTHLEERLAREEQEEVRAALVATMATLGMLTDEEASRQMRAIATGTNVASKVVLLEVIAWRHAEQGLELARELAEAPNIPVRQAAIAALGALGTDRAADALVECLGNPRATDETRRALILCGKPASDALVRALIDTSRPLRVRRQVPQVLVAVDAESGPLLLQRLRIEPDGMVRYRTLLALQALRRRFPDVRLESAVLDAEVRIAVARAYRYMERALVLEAGKKSETRLATPGNGLLVALMRDKQKNTVGRMFRLLALRFPQKEFDRIYLSIESGQRDYRAHAVELIHNVTAEPMRSAVMGLVDDVAEEKRLAFGEAFHKPTGMNYVEVIRRMLGSTSAPVRDLAAYHVGELKQHSLARTLEDLVERGMATPDILRALELVRTSDDVRLESLEVIGAR